MPDYDLGTARGRIVIDGSGAEKGVDQADKAVGNFTSKTQQHGQTLQRTGIIMGGIGTAIAAGFVVAMKTTANFEKAISGIAAVSGATDKEIDKLRAKALKLGADTVFSAGESAGAMEELVKAGLTVGDVLGGAADATVALAAAGEVDLKTAATIASNAMNQFGLSAEEMPKVADLIAGAANASAIDVGEFGMALAQAGAVAKLQGVSFDDLSVAIAEMGNAGIKGSDAGTSLKTFLNNLQPTTEKQIELMEKLGLVTLKGGARAKDYEAALKKQEGAQEKAKDAQERLNDLTAQYAARGPARNVEEATKRAAQLREAQEKVAETQGDLAKINKAVEAGVGKMSNAFYDAQGRLKPLSEISGILNEKLKGLTQQEKAQALETIFGSDAIRAAAVLTEKGAEGFDSLAASMGKVKAADVAAKRLDNLSGDLEQLKGSMETALISGTSGFQEAARGIVQSVTGMVNAFSNLSPGTQKLIVQLSLALAALLAAGGAFLYIVGTAFKFVSTLKKLNDAFKIVKGLKAVQGAMAALNTTFLANPVVLIVAAIVALGVALFVAYKKIKPFHEFVDNLWQSFQAGWDIVLPVLKDIGSAIVNFGKSAGRVFMAAVRGIVSAFKWLMELPGKIVAFFQALPGRIMAGLAALPRLIGFAIGFIIGMWLRFQIKMWTMAIELGVKVVGAIVGFLMELPGKIWKFLVAAYDFMVKFTTDMIDKAIEVGINVVKSIIDFLRDLPGKAWDMLLLLIAKLVDLRNDMVAKGTEIATGFVTNLIEGIKGLPGSVGDIIEKIITAIKEKIKTAFTAVKDFASGMWNGFKEGLGIHSPSFIEEAMTNMVGSVGSSTEALREHVKTMQGLAGGIPDLSAASSASVGALQASGVVAKPAPADPTAGLAQAVGSTVSFNVEQVVAQDPMEVMKKTEERARLAAISGTGRVRVA